METFIDVIMWHVFVADIMVILIGYCQEQYSPVMPTGRLQACRNKVKSHITTLNFLSLPESLKPWPCRVDLTITQSVWQGLGLRFSYKNFTLGLIGS